MSRGLVMQPGFVQTAGHLHTKPPFLVQMADDVDRKAGFRGQMNPALDAGIHGEMDRISQALTQRVKELAERYEVPLPKMSGRGAELESSVNRHLERMGFEWK